MNRVALAAVLVAASSTAASAGTYVGLGIGTGASVSDSQGVRYGQDGRSDRLALGWRLGRFSVEGAYTGYSVIKGNAADGGQYDSHTVVVAGKFNLPLGNNFEAFGRVGLLRSWLTPGSASNMDLSGDGWQIGGGFEYRLDLGVAGGGVFVDYTRNQATMDMGAGPVDQTASMWTLGLNLSL